jgi:hypothetical protein
MKSGLVFYRDLAAAVLMDALTTVCEPYDDGHRKRAVSEDLEWIFSDEIEGLFSFLQLCRLLGFEPSIVRELVLLGIFRKFSVTKYHQSGSLLATTLPKDN